MPEAEDQARSGSKRRKGHDVVLGLEKEQNMNQRTCAWVVSSIQIQ